MDDKAAELAQAAREQVATKRELRAAFSQIASAFTGGGADGGGAAAAASGGAPGGAAGAAGAAAPAGAGGAAGALAGVARHVCIPANHEARMCPRSLGSTTGRCMGARLDPGRGVSQVRRVLVGSGIGCVLALDGHRMPRIQRRGVAAGLQLDPSQQALVCVAGRQARRRAPQRRAPQRRAPQRRARVPWSTWAWSAGAASGCAWRRRRRRRAPVQARAPARCMHAAAAGRHGGRAAAAVAGVLRTTPDRNTAAMPARESPSTQGYG